MKSRVPRALRPCCSPGRVARVAVGISLGAFAAIGRAQDLRESATPLAYFLHSAGPAAAPVRVLDWALAALCAGVCVVIAGLLGFAMRRKRNVADPAATTRDVTANRIVLVGTIVSSLLLLGALVAMLRVLAAVAEPPREPALTIQVTAYDWWWKVTYIGPSGLPFNTANEIHIPTGEPVRILLQSADVIHAFWVPALAGKTQAIPGQVNRQWLQADRPGIWRGQCTQFCGPQHAHMAMEVIAQSPDDFAHWLDAQAHLVTAPDNEAAQRGEHVFAVHCAACHAVRGSLSSGAQAPDLTHLASRRWLGAGTLVNTHANRLDWVAHAQQIKPESLMPNIVLTPDETHDLGAWMDTLQ
ncbi:cytochrome c oxidase subunit II [Paraburkholderia acidisoli]|uniref:Cytochrome aa3 subunit 2 n=1 Tax=Paraburkholderia acidisoli TaxID=2571748 RepID=A0A7Z2GN75_9BURK|nr:cytochrome c oxidase subunit II [Paraburkholderia acidisoli]